MIDVALGVIVGQLNQALRRAFAIREDMAVLANILEQDGRVGPQVENKLVVSLVNIEREAVAQRDARPGRNPMARALLTPDPVHLNLSVMFAANFNGSNYSEALKMISGTIGFFQSRPVLDHRNTPELDRRIERLALDIANLSLNDLSNLWSILSGKYLPSILYRVRMVAVDLAQLSGQSRPVTQQHLTVLP
jgi:hypothetical protein